MTGDLSKIGDAFDNLDQTCGWDLLYITSLILYNNLFLFL